MTESEARRDLVAFGRRLLDEGLVARSWGNLSLRLDAKTMAVTPSGILWTALTEAMISLVDLETGEWRGDWKPSGERKVHLEVYRRRPEVGAVVHTHQAAASVWAAAHQAVPGPRGPVPCAPYGLPGSKALTRGTVEALGTGEAVLMANHGVFTVGPGLEEAFGVIRDLETRCADLVAARGPLPGRLDAPWDPTWLTPGVPLADGTPTWLSRAPYTQAWARGRRPLRASLDDQAQLAGRRVALVDQVPTSGQPGALALVKNQGLWAAGPEAETLAMVVEKGARAARGAEALGGARPLPAWEAEAMRLVYRLASSKQARA